MLALALSFRIPIIPTIPRPLGTALFLLHGSRHACVMVYRIQDSLHQALVRVRVIVLRRPLLWMSVVRVRVLVLVMDPATAFITHGSPW